MDVAIFQALDPLERSNFRSKFRLTHNYREYIASKDLETIKEHAYQFINNRVAAANPKNGGKQTPMRGHSVFIGNMPPPHVVGNVFKNGMESRRGGRSVMMRSIMMWR